METLGTETSFTHAPDRGALVAVLDVDASAATYLSAEFSALSERESFSFSFRFTTLAADPRVPPTSFVGLMTPRHVESFGDGLTVDLTFSGDAFAAHASLDNAGFKDEGERIPLAANSPYLAVGVWSPANRQLVVDIYSGPEFLEKVGTSRASLPQSRSFRVSHFGVQNGGARTQDSAVGSITLELDEFAMPARPPIILEIDDTSLVEGTDGASSASLALRLSVPVEVPVSVDFETVAGSAAAGADFRGTSGTAVIPAGSTGARLNILIVPDNLAEPEESFLVRLSQPINAKLGRTEAQVVLIDDDEPSLAVNSAEAVEGNDGSSLLAIPILLSNPSALTVSVRYRTEDGTARAGSDYAPTNGVLALPPGTTLGLIHVPILGDRITEGNETFTLRLSQPSQATLGAESASSTILDDDPVPWIDLGEAAGTEGNSGPVNLVIPVRLSNPSGVSVRIAYATADESATASTDYLPQNGILVFEPGQTEKVVVVPILGDTLVEGPESFRLQLSTPVGAQLGQATRSILIADDDSAPALRISDATTTEGASGSRSVLNFLVELQPPASRIVTVNYSTFAGSAAAGIDFISTSGTLVFEPGTLRKPIDVPVIGDDEAEPDETMAVRLSGVIGADLAEAEGTGTILTDDSVTISVDDTQVIEGDGTSVQATFQIRLKGEPLQPVTVGYFTANQSALSGQDYRAVNGQLTFSPGQSIQTISVPVFGDRINEPTETFELRLNAASGASLSRAVATASIIDNDPPSLSIDDVQLKEGSSGPTIARVAVRLSSPAIEEIRVEWITLGITASPGSDFVDAGGTLVFPPGTRERSVDVTIVGDTLHEANETLAVRLARPQGATLPQSPTEGVITIQDDDPAPRIRIEDREVTECTDGAGSVVLRITLSAPSEQEVRVNYGTFDGSATAGEDYQPVRGTVVFPPGTTVQEITVPLVCDASDEASEGFGVGLSGPVNGFFDGDGRGRVTVVDDDPPVITVENLASDEGDDGLTPFVFTLRLSSAAAGPISVEYTTADGSATAGTDYATVSGTLTLPAGALSGEIPVPVLGDTLPEGREAFELRLANPLGATLARSNILATILDDDQPRIRVADASVVEGQSGRQAARLEFSLTRTSPVPVEISYRTEALLGTAAPDLDYLPAQGVVRFAPGETAAFAEITILGDTLIETNETVRLTLDSAVNAEPLAGDAILTIVDDDGAPVLTVADRTLVEPSPGPQPLVFSLRLSAPSSATVRVGVLTADATARAGQDYVALRPAVVEFLPGITNRTVSVTVLPDDSFEPDESFLLVLTNVVNAVVARPQAVGSIQNDDPPSLLGIAGASLVEGPQGRATNLVFRVSLTPPSSAAVTVAFETLPITATPGIDFTPIAGRLEFSAGSSSATVSVPVLGDSVTEDNETLRVRLSDPVGAALQTAEATGTIFDDDGIPLLITGGSVREGDSGTTSIEFTVRLERAASELVTVDFATADGSASAGLDYRPAAGRLSFPPGISAQPVSIEVLGDALDEPIESFTVHLSNPVNAIIGTPSATGSILDDDPPVISIEDATVAASQTGAVDAHFRVLLSSSTSEPVVLEYRTSNGSATAGTDYTEVTRETLRFEPGETEKRITIQVKGNTLDEATEVFFVDLLPQPAPLGARLGLRSRGRGTILNPLESNRPPTVTLTAPENDQRFPIPAQISLAATASDPENSLVGVEFFAGLISLGMDATPPYTAVWSNAPAGRHVLTARALDAGGLTSTSAPVRIEVFVPNQPPTIANLDPASTWEDRPTSALPVVIDDSATPAGLLEIAVTSSRTDLVAPTGLVMGGSGRDRTLRATPLPDQFGSTTLTLTVRDPDGATAVRSFVLTVEPVNDAPTLAPLPDVRLPEDSPARTIPLTGIGSGAANESQVLVVSASSSNPSLVPTPVVTYQSPASTGSLTLQPRPDSQGTAIISVTVRDDGGTARGGRDTITRQFTVTVSAVNDPPTIAWRTPPEGARFMVGSGIPLAVTAQDPDDGIATVEFLSGDRVLAQVSQPPYEFTWTGAPAGTHRLTARARDLSGATAETPPRTIEVAEPDRNLTGGDILILRDRPDPEVDAMKRILEDSSLRIADAADRHLRPPVIVIAAPENLTAERLLEFRLVIWNDLGLDAPSLGDREIDLLWQAWRFGIPIYLLGENLALPGTRLSALAREQWYQLSGLAPGDPIAAPGIVAAQEPRDRPNELFLGSTEDTVGIVLPDFAYPNPTRPGRLIGDGEIRATRDGLPVLTRYPSFASPFDDSARRLVQSFRVLPDLPDGAQERSMLFLNGVVWLLGVDCDNFAATTDCELVAADPATQDPCAPVTFRTVVSNNGRCQVRGVRVLAQLPPGFQVTETRVVSYPEGINAALALVSGTRTEFAVGRMSSDSQVYLDVIAQPPGAGTFTAHASTRALFRPLQECSTTFPHAGPGCGPPQLEYQRGLSGLPEIRLAGTGTEVFVIETSEDLIRWTPTRQVNPGQWLSLAELLAAQPNPTPHLFIRARR